MPLKKHTSVLCVLVANLVVSFSPVIQASSGVENFKEKPVEKQMQKSATPTPANRSMPAINSSPAIQRTPTSDLLPRTPIKNMALKPNIIVTAPASGQAWRRESAQKVSWNKLGDMGSNVSITLMHPGDNAPLHKVLAPNSGNYSFPAEVLKNLPFGDYILHIETTDHSVSAYSQTFKLVPSALNIPQMSTSASEDYRYCPDHLMLDNIPTEPPSFEGFIGIPLANIPAKFTFSGIGRSSTTECYCQYQLGELKARIRADMAGYTSCSAGYIPKPGTNSQVKGIILHK